MLWIKITAHTVKKRLYSSKWLIGRMLETSEEHGDFKIKFMNSIGPSKSYFGKKWKTFAG
jgi:hypothetical protein